VFGEHLAGDLRVAGLVGSDEAEAVAAGEWSEAEEQQKEPDGEEDDELVGRGEGRIGGELAKPEGEAAWLRRERFGCDRVQVGRKRGRSGWDGLCLAERSGLDWINH
jgi:hypothetical protein